MLFNSVEFLVFLPAVFLLYWFVFRRQRAQNVLLLAASYVFYGWWDVRFLLLIALTSVLSYLFGRMIDQNSARPKARKAFSLANIALNIGILGIFKYYDFFADNLARLLGSFGLHADPLTLNLVLPVGISFYTFQAVGYTIDVYRKRVPACKDAVAFFAYISFFPQLVAGPIERAENLLPQFHKARRFDYAQAVDGCRQILWGFFKKMVVADNCAAVVNQIWGDYANQSGVALLMGGVLFTFQIYGDFSGYSDIAIGTARLFGFRLMRNFAFPYFSRDVAEFWRRWHISLTTWFRDYIYIPLGGSRCSKWKVMRNTLIVFLVSGFWHGANWTFIAWGAYHALLFFPLMLLGKNRKHTDIVAAGKRFPNAKELGGMLLTFFLVVIGWIIFRSESITQAADYLARMCSLSLSDLGDLKAGRLPFAAAFVLMSVEWMQRDKQHALQLSAQKGIFSHRTARLILYYIIVVATLVFAGDQETFIYFQF